MWPFKKEEEPRHSEEPPYLEKYGGYGKYAKCNKCGEMNDKSAFYTDDSCCYKCGNEEFTLVTARPKLFKRDTTGMIHPGYPWKVIGHEILEKN